MAVEIAEKWEKQCGEQELQVVWKYIYHIPLPYMDGTGLAGSIVSLTFDLSCICLPNQTLVIQVLIKFFSIQEL